MDRKAIKNDMRVPQGQISPPEAPIRKNETAKRKKPAGPFVKPPDITRIRGDIDRPMFIIILIMICFGSVMVFSSSYASAFVSKGDSFYYIKRQILWVAVGMLAMFIAIRFDYLWLRKFTVPAFIVTIGLLLVVLLYGLASGSAQRWIGVGSFTIQPSEVAKLTVVLMLAMYIARNQERITNYKNFRQASIYGIIIPYIILGSICLLVALEMHFSGTIIIFVIGTIVIFAGGALIRWFFFFGGAAIVIITPFLLFTDYASTRLTTWLRPELADPLGEGWQINQGLNAVGSGGLLGVGLGNSRQKHLFVSQPQNDFIFSIICEELGFIGALCVVALFMLFIWRGFVIALKAPDTFSTLVVMGIVCKVGIQAFLNIAVVTGIIPTTGISLPFFSYGGTALIMQLGEMGIVLSISRYSYKQDT